MPFLPRHKKSLNKNKLFWNTVNLFYCTDFICLTLLFSGGHWSYLIIERTFITDAAEENWQGGKQVSLEWQCYKAPGKLGLSVLINIFHHIYHKSFLTKTGSSGMWESIYYRLQSALIDVERLETLWGFSITKYLLLLLLTLVLVE